MRFLELATTLLVSLQSVFHPVGSFGRSKAIREIDDIRRRWEVSGLAVSRITRSQKRGGRWEQESAFFGQSTAQGDALTGDDYWALGQISEVFTAVALGLLIQNGTELPNGGLLEWHTLAKDAFPRWSLQDKHAEGQTDLWDILTMRTGVPGHDLARLVDPDETLDQLPLLASSRQFRESFQVNLRGYQLLGVLFPHLAGTSYEDYVRKHIFNPLGMSHTDFTLNALGLTYGRPIDGFYHLGRNYTTCRDDFAHKQLRSGGSVPRSCKGERASLGWWSHDEQDQRNLGATGGIISTAHDMTKWLQELMDPQVLPKDLISLIQTPTQLTGRNDRTDRGICPILWALGQYTYHYRGHRLIDAFGRLPGQRVRTVLLPDDGQAFFLASNDLDFGDWLHTAAVRLMIDEALGLPPIDWEALTLQARSMDVDNFAPPTDEVTDDQANGKGIVGHTFSSPGYPTLNFKKLWDLPESLINGLIIAADTLSSRHHLRSRSPAFVSAYENPGANYMVLSLWEDKIYNYTLLNIPYHDKPEGYPVLSGGCILTEQGIEMYDNFWTGDGGRAVESEEPEVVFKRS